MDDDLVGRIAARLEGMSIEGLLMVRAYVENGGETGGRCE